MTVSSVRPGLSSRRFERAGEVLSGYVERGDVPGLVYLAGRGAEVHVEALGTLQQAGSSPVSRDSIFRISSMTKPVTAVAVLMLVEECRLRLDDPVERWLPELANRRVLRSLESDLDDTVPAARSITVRDLLTFTGGMGMVMAMPDTYPVQIAMEQLELGQGAPGTSSPPEPDEWIRRVGSLPLIHEPGERWMYGTGSDILGVLVARVTGQHFEDALQERLFGPLGMTDTAFHVEPAKQDRFATAYWTDSDSGGLTFFDDPADGQWSRPPAFPSGAGGLVSTVDDFHAFARMLLNGGVLDGTRILARPTVDLMTSDMLSAEQKASSGDSMFATTGWGLGVSVVTRRMTISDPVGAYGWAGGLGSIWCNNPTEDLITIFLTQAAWSSPEPPPIAKDALTLAVQAIDD